MRTINEIQAEILEIRQNTPSLSPLEVLTQQEINLTNADSESKVSIWRLWVYVQAVAIYTLEKLMDIYRQEVNEQIAQSRIHTRDWYRQQALNYQYGQEVTDNGTYDNTGLTEVQIATAKIVKHASVLKYIINGRGVLRVKVAKDAGGELVPMTTQELTVFKHYMNRVADAGTTVIPTSNVHDDLRLELDIYYDPTLLDNQGARLDGTDAEPVKNKIKAYLKGLEFDGRFIKTHLTDQLQAVEGVILPKIRRAWSKYGNYTYETVGQNVGEIDEIRVADAGYMKLDEETSVINFIPYES